MAARWCAAVYALSMTRRMPPASWTPEQFHSFERTLAEVRAALDPASFDRVWEAGQALSLEEVIGETRAASYSTPSGNQS